MEATESLRNVGARGMAGRAELILEPPVPLETGPLSQTVNLVPPLAGKLPRHQFVVTPSNHHISTSKTGAAAISLRTVNFLRVYAKSATSGAT
jgi:hypothetical protein